MKNLRTTQAVIIITLSSYCFAPEASAQDAKRKESAAVSSQPKTVLLQVQEKPAAPQHIIALKVTGPDDSWARASVIEGGALRVIDNKTGQRYAFFPLVDSDNKRNVKVKVFQVHKDNSNEKLDEIENVSVLLGSAKATNTSPQFNIIVEAIAKHFPQEGQPFKANKVKTKDVSKPPKQ